jgi:hypothetical protein
MLALKLFKASAAPDEDSKGQKKYKWRDKRI